VREFSVRFIRSARMEIERLDATVVERVKVKGAAPQAAGPQLK
jgi:hypothetical protein